MSFGFSGTGIYGSSFEKEEKILVSVFGLFAHSLPQENAFSSCSWLLLNFHLAQFVWHACYVVGGFWARDGRAAECRAQLAKYGYCPIGKG